MNRANGHLGAISLSADKIIIVKGPRWRQYDDYWSGEGDLACFIHSVFGALSPHNFPFKGHGFCENASKPS